MYIQCGIINTYYIDINTQRYIDHRLCISTLSLHPHNTDHIWSYTI